MNKQRCAQRSQVSSACPQRLCSWHSWHDRYLIFDFSEKKSRGELMDDTCIRPSSTCCMTMHHHYHTISEMWASTQNLSFACNTPARNMSESYSLLHLLSRIDILRERA